MQRSLLLLGLAAAAAFAACAPSEPVPPAGPTVTVVDGVRIVENHAPVWGEGRGWRLSDAPILTLGVDAGEPHEMLTSPDALRLENGTIVVADRGATELRYFDENGVYLGTAGRRGQGPGEFTRIRYIFPAGNSVLVTESSGNRISRFGFDGSLVETFEQIDHDDQRYNPSSRVEGVFGDGSILAYSGVRLNRETFTWPGIGVGERGWLPAGVFRYSADGEEVEHLAEVGMFETGFREGWPVPFQARGFIRPYSQGFYHVNGRSNDIEDYTTDGELRARFRSPREPQLVTEEDNERWLQKSRENSEAAGRVLAPERVAEIVLTETMPMWRNLVVDSADNAWVERHLGLQHSQPLYWGNSTDPRFPETDSEWDVFDAEGVWLGTVALIPSRTVEQIGDAWVLLSGEDETGVAHVWLYELIKP